MNKRIVRKLAAAALALAAVAVLGGCGEEKESITVFNYGMYIDPDILDIFEEETGIEVKYEEATTPEELYTKYTSGAISYDLLCTSDYMVERLINEGEAQKIDFDKLEYAENIGDTYWEFAQSFDPDNQYALPYFWGTVGILYDKTKVRGPVDSWSVLFDGSYAGEIIMQDSVRDAFMVAEKHLGYSLNSTDKEEINEAKELLAKQKPDVEAYLVDEVRDEIVAGNATMGVIYSGEAYLGKEYNENLEYVVPREGSNVWLDAWLMTKKCENAENAEKFLSFLCREDIAMRNFECIWYSSPNKKVLEAIGDEYADDPAINPPEEVLENCEVYKQLDAETTQLYSDLWKEIKSN